ncbi:MAG: sensor histidine kinase [Gemmatimonadota bacterium]
MKTISVPEAGDLAAELGRRLRESREELVTRWLERITARVALTPERIFPTQDLLNHVPLLIDGVAHYLEHPEDELDNQAPVVAKAMELGALRHSQGFDAYEILKEHEILGGVIFTFLTDVVMSYDLADTPTSFVSELLTCWQRTAHAIELIRQATVTHFMRIWSERVNEREGRLRSFNRMVSHELKNRVGAISGATTMLGEHWLNDQQRTRFHDMLRENSSGLLRVLSNLEALSRIDADARQRRHIMLPQAAAEAARQLREPAESRGVSIRIAEDLPAVEVDAAAVELCLANYISNAIKYADTDKTVRWVDVSAELKLGEAGGGGELIVRVSDNGIGVPPESRPQLFHQFYRAHGDTVTGIEGTGLGLSIVRETAESLGGRAWFEFPASGSTVFVFSLPSRRETDAASAGTERI